MSVYHNLAPCLKVRNPWTYVASLLPEQKIYWIICVVMFQEDAGSGIIKYRVLQIQECEVNNADLALVAGPDIT